MEQWLKDLRHGARMLLSRPGFAAVAIASLALGIGLNTTLFSVVNAVLLRDTGIQTPERLVEIYSSVAADFPQLTTSHPDFLSIRESVPALNAVVAHTFVRGILGGGTPVLSMGEAVSGGYFELLGVAPSLGRAFLPEETALEGAHAVVVLSHGLWQRRFGSRAEVLGQTLEISGHKYSVVGVAPRSFAGTVPGLVPEFWVPLAMVDRLSFAGVQANMDTEPGLPRMKRRGHRWLFVKGRLADGRTLEQARAELETLYARLRADHPTTNEKVKPTVLPLASIRFHPMLDGYVKAASVVLLGAVSLVLLIACANVANMLLARATARRRELSVRAALGASRGRLLRQLLSESAVLAVAGGALGVLIAYASGRALSALPSDSLPLPLHFDFGIDLTVLGFAALASLATTLLFGLAPALLASKLDLVASLKADVGGQGASPRRITLRDVLVVGQLAMSLLLLVSGALLTRGLLVARGTDPGYDPRPLSSLGFNLQMNGYDVERATAMRRRAIEELRALPGVHGVGYASRLPLDPNVNMEGIRIEGHHTAGDDPALIDSVEIDAGYFEAVAVALVEGRAFTEADVATERKLVIVNETMARRYWPGRSALGQRIYTNGFDEPPHEIIGVARDHKVRSLGETPRPYLHFPAEPQHSVSLVIRTSAPATAALPSLRAAILRLEPNLVFTEDAPATEVLATTLAPTRIGALLLGAFGALALLLAAAGLYGVIAYSVSLRTREVGVRMALGARPRDVLSLVLSQGARLAACGVLIGGFLAALASRVLESLLYGVSAVDPIAYTLATAVLLLLAGAANFAPALAASRIDPMRALRSE
jgi:predicted permease